MTCDARLKRGVGRQRSEREMEGIGRSRRRASNRPCRAVPCVVPSIRAQVGPAAFDVAVSSTSPVTVLRPTRNELIEVNAVTAVGRVALDDVRPPCVQLGLSSESESRFGVPPNVAAYPDVAVRSGRADQRRRSCLRLVSVPNHCLEATHDLRRAPQAQR